jgi:hypothetical protein
LSWPAQRYRNIKPTGWVGRGGGSKVHFFTGDGSMRARTLAAALTIGVSAVASATADDASVQAELQALKARVEQQDKELAALKASEGDAWLNQRRAEEIKGLIHEVLSDAETRASLQEGGLTAGWRDHFFLASEDGNFLMRLSGQVQTRYMWLAESGGETDDNETSYTSRQDDHYKGFAVPRAKIRFDGHLFDPKFTYALQLNVTAFGYESGGEGSLFDGESDAGDSFVETIGVRGQMPGAMLLEDAWAAYEFADGWQAKVGQFKAPFLREELVDSKYQLAVERSFVANYFTVDYTQGIQLAYNGELAGTPFRAAVMMHDGSYQANTGFNSDTTDFAVAARGEVLLAGTWEQFSDFAAWSSDGFGLMVGAAIDWEEGETGDTQILHGVDDTHLANPADLFKWTIDVSLEIPEFYGFNAFGAVIGQHLCSNGGDLLDEITGKDRDQYAFVLQSGIFIIPDQWDVFGRFEWVDLNDFTYYSNLSGLGGVAIVNDDEDDFDKHCIFTFGTNYYFKKHAAKATFDVMWVLNTFEDVNDPMTGVTEDGGDDEDQIVLRGQFQFLF